MAGDDIQIGRGAFLMIHNCWVYAMGNRHDFAELAQSLEPFDTAMADIYAARSGLDIAAVQKLMDTESYIGGSDAVAKGLADSLLSADAVSDGLQLRFANLMHCWRKQIPPGPSAGN
ncbi:peptidase S14 ClpP [Klebsiella pneumoniae]|nr:peptidase S14 ClpP [Klebsiella pneumoniae]